jgi:NADH:ubiquinone oxidoreductase subunit 3 (subunit A)
MFNRITKKNIIIPSFFHTLNTDNGFLHSEDILGNLMYFIIANLIIAILLLSINYYFSLSIKYLEKGGGFECGFTSFVQTRERFNVIFYRISLLFLVFDLEIILAFPYTAIYQKNQNIGKNNVLAFLYILIVGFIYELKEGALIIVKKAHTTEINDKK